MSILKSAMFANLQMLLHMMIIYADNKSKLVVYYVYLRQYNLNENCFCNI